MEMIPIDSTAFEAIGYDKDRLVLRVRFKDGNSDYDHCGVPTDLFAEFWESESKGKFYANRIRDRYQC